MTDNNEVPEVPEVPEVTSEEVLEQLCTLEKDSQEQRDKLVVVLSSGGLVISLLFTVMLGNPSYLYYIIAAYICFGVAIVSVVLSFGASHLTARAAQYSLLNNIEMLRVGFFDVLIILTNTIAVLAFTIAMICSITFASLNIG